MEKGRSSFPVTAIGLEIWSQKLDQAKRAAGRDKPCVATSPIVELILLNSTTLESVTAERWHASKPFGNFRSSGYFKKQWGCLEPFREYCLCQLHLLPDLNCLSVV